METSRPGWRLTRTSARRSARLHGEPGTLGAELYEDRLLEATVAPTLPRRKPFRGSLHGPAKHSLSPVPPVAAPPGVPGVVRQREYPRRKRWRGRFRSTSNSPTSLSKLLLIVALAFAVGFLFAHHPRSHSHRAPLQPSLRKPTHLLLEQPEHVGQRGQNAEDREGHQHAQPELSKHPGCAFLLAIG